MRELRDLRCDVLFLQVQVKLLKFHRIVTRFNPDQPRVPASNPDGGQWTSDGGGDAQIHPVNDPAGRFKNDLIIHEGMGEGHTIKEHVAKSDEYLFNRVREFQSNLNASRFIARSFSSLDSANDHVNSTLEAHQTTVDMVASGVMRGARIATQFDAPTGREAFAASRGEVPYMRDTYSVRVVIIHSPKSPFGYWIHTAFPSNR